MSNSAKNWTPAKATGIVDDVKMASVQTSREPKSPMMRGCVAVLGFLIVGLGITSPGCLPTLPAIPTIAPVAPELQVPQAPELKIPEFTPPTVEPPEGPELPAKPPEGQGNCCIRKGNLLKKECQGAMSCCVDKFEDAGECEEVEGLWFFSKEGCAGAC